MKEVIKAIVCATVVMGGIIGILILGIWINAGSRTALTIALFLMWAAGAFAFYCNRKV